MHDDYQIHVLMDATVDVEGASRVKWANRQALTGSADLDVVHLGGTRLLLRLGNPVHPLAVSDNMQRGHVIHKGDGASLADRHR